MSDDTEATTAKAAEMGWVPKEEWKGDPEKWRPAEEFVSRGENIIPILKDQIKKTRADLEMALKVNAKEIEAIKGEAYGKAKAEYEAKLRTLDAKELEAFQSGDGEAYIQVKKERAAVRPPSIPAPVQAPQTNPVFEDWREKNPWYGDPELTEYADFVGTKIAHETPGAPLADIYAKVTERVKKARPDKFTNPRRDEPGAVEGGTHSTGGKKNGKSFSDIPNEAQAQYARMAKNFERQGRKFTKEQYAASYFE